ncbi:unnamed protein product [Orchesella dallaii]|uniref:Uncharacterized protein n=1 Tax=Orchesella dallaii TaxID=48710 RepID=A0ABP1R982_9HEXA
MAIKYRLQKFCTYISNMAFRSLIWVVAVLSPISPIASTFPITFGTNCFVRIVYEGNLNYTLPTPTKIPLPLAMNAASDIILSYMIQDVSNFSFAFDVEDIYLSDQLTISDGYFPFFSKYSKTCDLFILLTDTFNSTTTAIQKTGYGNSDYATFLVVVECCNGSLLENNIIAGFLSDFKSLEKVSFNAIYSSLAFITLPELDTKSETIEMEKVYAYCYYCPKALHQIEMKFELISLPLSEIHFKCQKLNNNGWNRKAFLLVNAAATSYDGLLANIEKKIEKGRISFARHLNESYMAEFYLLRMTSVQMNLSIDPNLRHFGDDDESYIHWHLSIKKIATILARIRNDVSATRGSFIVTHQETVKLIYCMETSELIKIKWDIYLRVFDLLSWICIIITIFAYAFIYKSFSRAIDLAWILLDMEFRQRHPRKILVPYIIAAMFLHWSYDSGMSTDFIDFDFPFYSKELLSTGHKVWHVEVSPVSDNIKQMKGILPESIQKFLEKNSGLRDIENTIYTEYGYYLPENLYDRVKAIADKKLLLLNGDELSITFPSLVMTLAAMKKAVIEEKFICGMVHQYPSTNLQLTHSFFFRGFLSTKFANLFETFLEAGLLGHIQGLMRLQKALKKMVRVDDINVVLSSSNLGVRTPLGIVCAAYIALNFTFLVYFIGSIVNKHWARVTRKIRDFYELHRKWGGNNVEVFKEEDLT